MLYSSQIATMKRTQSAHMHDTCVIQTYASTQDDAGQEIATYTDGLPVSCGFESMVKPGEVEGPNHAVIKTDARVRLSHTDGANVDIKSRIKITHRYGELLATPDVFEIVSEPHRGPSGVRLELKRVQI